MANSDLIQSLLRGVDILIMLADHDGGMRVNEIAEAVGVKPPTAHNLLRTLAARNLVEKRASKYCLGAGVSKIARLDTVNQFREKCRQALLRLVRTYPDANYTIATQREDGLHIWLRVSADRPGMIQEPTGGHFRIRMGMHPAWCFRHLPVRK